MKLNDFLKKLDPNFQLGIVIIDENNNYYCINQDDYEILNRYISIETLSQESIQNQKDYISKKDFEINEIKSMYFKTQFIEIHVK